jgi:hypothetical protein
MTDQTGTLVADAACPSIVRICINVLSRRTWSVVSLAVSLCVSISLCVFVALRVSITLCVAIAIGVLTCHALWPGLSLWSCRAAYSQQRQQKRTCEQRSFHFDSPF